MAVQKTKMESGYYLVQRSRTYGLQEIWFSPKMLRILSIKSGVTYVSKAPKWDVLIFSTRTKSYFSTPFKKFNGFGQRAKALLGDPLFIDLPFKKVGSATIENYKASLYVVPREVQNKQVRLIEAGAIGKRSARSARCYLAEDLGVPPEIGRIMARIYGIKELDGIPLKFTYYTVNGVPKDSVDLRQFKKMSFDTSKFQVPPKYKLVSRGEEVFEDDLGKEGMNSMLQELGRPGQFNADSNLGDGL